MDRLGLPRTFITPRRAGRLVPVLAILIAGCSAAAAPPAAPSALPAPSSGSAEVGAPAIAAVPGGLTTSVGSASSGSSGSASSNMAIAYPYPGLGGSAGLAPDHELVVSGTGWTTVKVDLSNRASAQRSALGDALADAKTQAQAAASDAGVTLGGVVSMSVSVNSNYALPMGMAEPPTGPSTGGGAAVPPATAGSLPGAPTTELLEVTVTVAYTIS
jgi:hypothetical protein